MKFTLIASAFAAVKANEEPNFIGQAKTIVYEQNGGNVAETFMESEFSVYAED
jgi:hypothetical protein